VIEEGHETYDKRVSAACFLNKGKSPDYSNRNVNIDEKNKRKYQSN
jgi:hypothetical protein